jgi:hypothetical protein
MSTQKKIQILRGSAWCDVKALVQRKDETLVSYRIGKDRTGYGWVRPESAEIVDGVHRFKNWRRNPSGKHLPIDVLRALSDLGEIPKTGLLDHCAKGWFRDGPRWRKFVGNYSLMIHVADGEYRAYVNGIRCGSFPTGCGQWLRAAKSAHQATQ